MTSARSYAAAMTHSGAMLEVRSGSGAQFCPRAVRALGAVLVEDVEATPLLDDSDATAGDDRSQG